METLEEAKLFLRENWEKGVNCPCCGQFVKLYRRKITSSMAYSLLLFRKNEEWTHAETFFFNKGQKYAGGGDFPKLRFWNLIEKKLEVKEDGNPNSGFYKISQSGKDFALGLKSVSKYIYLFKDKIRERSSQQVTIKEALGNKFNYFELMNNL